MVNAPEAHRVRYVSTGRGGAANFKKVTALADRAQADTSNATGAPFVSSATAAAAAAAAAQDGGDDDDGGTLTRVVTKASLGARFATGRGGAGNMLPPGTVPLPTSDAPPSTHLSVRQAVSVGRGGAGNFKDVKTGRSYSASTSHSASATPTPSSSTTATATRPGWASRVPKIDADLDSTLSSSAAFDDDNDDNDDDVDLANGRLGRSRRASSQSLSRGRRNSVFSTKSAPAEIASGDASSTPASSSSSSSFFGKMRRRFSSFGTALE